MTGGNRRTGKGHYPAQCLLVPGPCLCIINSLISELWTTDVSCQILLEIHKFVTSNVTSADARLTTPLSWECHWSTSRIPSVNRTDLTLEMVQ